MLHALVEDSSDEDDVVVVQHRQRVYQPKAEYLNAVDFHERFRLTPWQADLLLGIIGPDLQTTSRTPTAMTPKHKLMAALRFYASNGFYYFVGDGQGKLRF